ncbi:hypothetical protein ACJMK2_020844 [Sinanodonta woodiana]|uniref:Cysteine and tyrosine-rich protein 1 n=1 Tax=Sinanodonta woodiana TaxID=1069815 RepID=A0ABD3U0E3_SINWO
MFLHYTIGLFFLVSHIGCALGEYCSYYTGSLFQAYMFCPYGCCGYYSNQYCCANVGAIVGGVIGALAGLGILITIISCLCCACCQATRQRFSGTVLRTNPNPSVTTTVAVQQPGYVQQPYYGQPYVIQNAGYQSMQTQSPAGNAAYVQGDAKTGYPTGPATYQAAQAPPPYLE